MKKNGKNGKKEPKANPRNGKKDLKAQQREKNIIEGALKVFGEKGFEETTISAISKAAKISDATIYEYFSSKEDLLFSIAKLYTQEEFGRVMSIVPYIHGAKAKLRMIIQAHLEFYENNRLYTSVALLTLKGSRNFMKSEAYKIIKKTTNTIITVYNEGIEEGVFRDDIDPYIVRNMTLGFIEHLTAQWLLLGRPANLSAQTDNVYSMILKSVEKDVDQNAMKITIEGFDVQQKKDTIIIKAKKKK